MTFGFLVGSRTFVRSFVFPEKFLFYADMPGSIGWPSPAPRLRIDDCFEIRNCRLGPCDLLLSSHQNFQHEVQLHHCTVLPSLVPLQRIDDCLRFTSFGKTFVIGSY